MYREVIIGQKGNPSSLRWQDIGTFLFFGSVFVIPSGYSIGAAILLIGSLLTFRASDLKDLDLRVWFVAGAFALYAFFWSADGLLRGEGIRELDRPIRFLLAAFVLIRLYRSPPSNASIFFGIGLGSLAAGFVASYEYYWIGMSRANGFMPTNSFGMLAALYTGLSLSILQMLRFSAGYRCVSLISALGGFSACAAALLSGSRGAFLTLAGLGVWLLAVEVLRYRRWHIGIGLTLSFFLVGVALYSAPGTPVKQRVDAAVTSVTAYVIDGERVGSSIPARLDMWQGGLVLFLEKPLFGWGESGYHDPLEDLVERGVIKDDRASGRHLHNQFIHVLAAKGSVGALILSLLLFAPIWCAKNSLHQSHRGILSNNVIVSNDLIVLMVLAYVIGGLTRVPMEHHSGVMVFAFSTAIIFAFTKGNDVAS
jgi:O-antigen ligase